MLVKDSSINNESDFVRAPTQPVPVLKDFGTSLFGTHSSLPSREDRNPFSTTINSNVNPFSSKAGISTPSSAFNDLAAKPQQAAGEDLSKTFAEKARISPNLLHSTVLATSIPQCETWPKDAEMVPAYPFYHLDADYETLDAGPQPIVPNQDLKVDEGDEFGNSRGGKEETDTFESTIDKTFQRFADRLAQNPLQALRYEYKGVPLLYCKMDAVGKLLSLQHSGSGDKIVTVVRAGLGPLPRCQNCSAGRVFELQLTPQAIAEVEIDEPGLEGMEWGTIILGVCSKDCQAKGVEVGSAGYLEEWVGIQWEEIKGPRK